VARIIHVCPRYLPARGGAEAFFAKLGEALASRGDAVSVWTTDAPTVRGFTVPGAPRLPAGPERIGGVEVRRFPVRYLPGQRWTRTAAHWLPFGTRWKCDTLRWTPYVPSMTRAAAQSDERVDLVHAGGLPYSSVLYAGVRLAERTGARLVVSPFTHLPRPGSTGGLMRQAYLSPLNVRLLARADRVFVQTALEGRVLAEAGLCADRQTLIGLGVDPEETTGGHRDRARAGWGVGPDTVVIGHLANKSWDKGTVDLLDAAERLWAQGRTFSLVLAGPEMPNFTQRWQRAAFRDRVVNLPELSDDERRDFFAGLDVFALPSYVESFGLSPLEAALNGAAVIAYNHGGPGEIFQHDVSALLPSPGDLDALAGALDRLVRDSTARTRLASAARNVALAHPWLRALEAAVGACDQVLRGRRTG
jgi:glycosyltransferase involved in cell wall biosynthesis